MKKLTTSTGGVLGPFRAIKVLSDRFLCDDIAYPFTVVGDASIADATPGEFPKSEDLVEGARKKKRVELEEAYERAKSGGFVSSALGSPHTYPSSLEAQLDLMGTVLRKKASPFASVDGAGKKQARTHTPAQIEQVLEDGASYKLGLYLNLQNKLAAVDAAQTVAAVAAVSW